MEIVRGSDEDGERENERSIFNMVVPKGFTRNPLLGASICAVPLSLPIPEKNYFKNRLSREINVFSRTSAYFCGEEKKWRRKRKIGQQVYSLFHNRSSCLHSFSYNRGKLVSS